MLFIGVIALAATYFVEWIPNWPVLQLSQSWVYCR